MTINPELFPVPESAYCTNGITLDRFASISILAFNVNLILAGDNILGKEGQKKGQFFGADAGVPLPRPCTILAWERLCRLGSWDSRLFIVPFLPALREEDEVGSAIGERGIHLPSLSRRSNHHVIETIEVQGKTIDVINWGFVYIGDAKPESTINSILISKVSRSNVVEALVAPMHRINPETSQESIRFRMEFLAQHGLPSLYEFGKQAAAVPILKRILFRFTDQMSAARWGLAYAESYDRVRRDPGLIDADWQDMLHDYMDSMRAKDAETQEPVQKENKISQAVKVKQDFSMIDL